MSSFSRLNHVFRWVAGLSFSLAMPIAAQSELMELSDVQGRKITAKLISCDEEAVTVIQKESSATISIKLAQLDESTRKRITGWVSAGGNLTEKYELLVETNKTRKKDGSEDFDDKRVNLNPAITIKNPDTKTRTRDGSMTVLFLGRPVDSATDIFVFKKQEFDLPRLEPLESKTFTMEEISQAYDSRGLAKFGSRYLGYAILIHDAAAERILFSRSVPPGLVTDYGLKLLALKDDSIYNRELKIQPKRR